jgi:hypothetical protein
MDAQTRAMIDRFGAAGPGPAAARQLDLFGQFVGAWDLEWRGEESTDGGRTWVLNDEMYATRRRE